MVKSITGSYKVSYHPEGPDGEVYEVDYSPPFARFKMLPDLEKEIGMKLPAATELHTEGLVVFFYNSAFFYVINNIVRPRHCASLKPRIETFCQKNAKAQRFDHKGISGPL